MLMMLWNIVGEAGKVIKTPKTLTTTEREMKML